MEAFDESEYTRWRRAAEESLRVARHNRDGGFHHAAVFHAEQAAQCALKGLLHAVGAGGRARQHGLLSLADACTEAAGFDLSSTDLRERLGGLARHYQTTRYPDALPEGTPADHYGPAAAGEAIATAERTVAAVDGSWTVLQAAMSEQESDTGHDGAP